MILFPAQIRAARATLKITQDELAKEANLGILTIKNIETDENAFKKAHMETILKIKSVFEKRGIRFLVELDNEGNIIKAGEVLVVGHNKNKTTDSQS